MAPAPLTAGGAGGSGSHPSASGRSAPYRGDSGAGPEPAAPRLVLIGASNLTRGIPTALAVASALLPRPPAEVLLAAGHGRAFGVASRVLARTLPPVLTCGLWRCLEGLPPAPTFALLTDLGNDLAYGRSAEALAADVTSCLERLGRLRARVVVTLPPTASVAALPGRRFRLARGLLFPGRAFTLGSIVAALDVLEERLPGLALSYGALTVRPPAAWYGPDGIHLRRRYRRAAWQAFLTPWRRGAASSAAVGRAPSRLPLLLHRPERWWLAGRERHRQQPTGRYAGSQLYVF